MEVDDVVTIVRDGFWHTLPPLVAGLSDQPLYIAVAMWGKLSGTLLTTETVSRTFSLPQGRARDVIHYIAHEGRSYVTSERLTLYVDGSVIPAGGRLKSGMLKKSRQVPYGRRDPATGLLHDPGLTEFRRKIPQSALHNWNYCDAGCAGVGWVTSGCRKTKRDDVMRDDLMTCEDRGNFPSG